MDIEDESNQSLLPSELEVKDTASLNCYSRNKGISYIFGVVLIWVCSSFVIQLEEEEVGALSLTLLSTATFTCLIPFNLVSYRKTCMFEYRLLLVTIGLFPLWLAASYTYNLSLCSTSITTSTLLSSTSSVFTFLISYLIGLEKGTMLQGGGIVLCLIGIYLTTLSAEKESFSEGSRCTHLDTWIGNGYALISSFFYALYSIYLKITLKREEDSALVFSLIGLFSLLILFPVFLVFPYLFENLRWNNIKIILFNALFNNVIADVLWGKAIVLTSPTTVTVGIALTIPFTAIADTLVNNIRFSGNIFLSAIFVVSGFLAVLLKKRGSMQ